MEKKQLILDGISVTYYEQGTGKTVIFLHGGRLRALAHEHLLYELAKQYHIIAPDIPVYGESSGPGELWTFKEYADFFNTFIKKLQIDRPIVIGYSLGGGIALYLSSMNKDVEKLVLIDSAGLDRPTGIALTRDLNRLWFYASHPQYFPVLLKLLKEFLLFNKKHFLELRKINQLRDNALNTATDIEKIKAKTLLIWAKGDTIFPLNTAGKFHSMIINSQLSIAEGNHDWIFMNEKKLLELLHVFIMANDS
ncbi:alpha/beta hydrolase [Candidatus Roizmanbacteria bacterium]|nr:alpha/beta hydrolase [Candidatus Roizmanbacteria bacterium]